MAADRVPQDALEDAWMQRQQEPPADFVSWLKRLSVSRRAEKAPLASLCSVPCVRCQQRCRSYQTTGSIRPCTARILPARRGDGAALVRERCGVEAPAPMLPVRSRVERPGVARRAVAPLWMRDREVVVARMAAVAGAELLRDPVGNHILCNVGAAAGLRWAEV